MLSISIGLSLILSYLIGSIPFGLILTKVFTKQDIRTIGSGNIGATNVLRTGNKKLAILTLILDMLKGACPIILFASPQGLLLGLFAIIGHCFPIWLNFKGGKGVATAFGVLLATNPLIALVCATTWGIVAGFTYYSSFAALCAVAIAPFITFILYGAIPASLCSLISILIFIRHKENIERLLNGEETKIGSKKKEDDEPVSK